MQRHTDTHTSSFLFSIHMSLCNLESGPSSKKYSVFFSYSLWIFPLLFFRQTLSVPKSGKKKKSLPNLVSSVHQFLSSVWSLLTPNIGYESPFTDRKTKNPLTFFLWFSGPFLPSNSPGPCAMFQTQGSLWRAPGSPLCRLTALLQRPPASSAAARPYTQPPLLAGPSDPFSFSIPTLFQRILLVALLSLCV